MEEARTLPQIRLALMDAARVLQEFSDQAYHIESHIKRVAGSIYDLEKGELPAVDVQKEPNIIPFPVSMYQAPSHTQNALQPDYSEKTTTGHVIDRPFLYEGPRKHPFLVPILAKAGESLPVKIPDFREQLQRDGLILLSWDKRITERGELFTAYWVTSTGICRYFASNPLPGKDFAGAHPDHKSYAAEDGIEFYGQPRPYYIVHVAPELMMNLRGKTDERPEHIKKLKELGVKTNFEYRYLLTKEKNKFPCKRTIRGTRKTGA